MRKIAQFGLFSFYSALITAVILSFRLLSGFPVPAYRWWDVLVIGITLSAIIMTAKEMYCLKKIWGDKSGSYEIETKDNVLFGYVICFFACFIFSKYVYLPELLNKKISLLLLFGIPGTLAILIRTIKGYKESSYDSTFAGFGWAMFAIWSIYLSIIFWLSSTNGVYLNLGDIKSISLDALLAALICLCVFMITNIVIIAIKRAIYLWKKFVDFNRFAFCKKKEIKITTSDLQDR